MASEKLEKLKLFLDRQKFSFEKEKHAQDSNVINKHFGAIIAAIVSLSAVFVSSAQIYISATGNNNKLLLDKSKTDREFELAISRFLMEQRDQINTNDIGKLMYVRNVVIASFPPEYVAKISLRMQDISQDERVKQIWGDSYVYASATTTKIAAQAEATSASTQNTPNNKLSLTPEIITKKFPRTACCNDQLEAIFSAAKEFKIASRDDLNLFIAWVLHNTNYLSNRQETLSYLSTERIVAAYPGYFRSSSEARLYINRPEDLANLVYGLRMGNTEPSDGYKFRGRGYALITGRGNYRKVSNGLNLGNLLEEDPSRLLSDYKLDALAAAYVFREALANVKPDADFPEKWRRLQGGLAGLASIKTILDKLRFD